MAIKEESTRTIKHFFLSIISFGHDDLQSKWSKHVRHDAVITNMETRQKKQKNNDGQFNVKRVKQTAYTHPKANLIRTCSEQNHIPLKAVLKLSRVFITIAVRCVRRTSSGMRDSGLPAYYFVSAVRSLTEAS